MIIKVCWEVSARRDKLNCQLEWCILENYKLQKCHKGNTRLYGTSWMYLAPYGGRVLNINQGGHRRSRFGVPAWLLVSERRRHIGGRGYQT